MNIHWYDLSYGYYRVRVELGNGRRYVGHLLVVDPNTVFGREREFRYTLVVPKAHRFFHNHRSTSSFPNLVAVLETWTI